MSFAKLLNEVVSLVGTLSYYRQNEIRGNSELKSAAISISPVFFMYSESAQQLEVQSVVMVWFQNAMMISCEYNVHAVTSL